MRSVWTEYSLPQRKEHCANGIYTIPLSGNLPMESATHVGVRFGFRSLVLGNGPPRGEDVLALAQAVATAESIATAKTTPTPRAKTKYTNFTFGFWKS